MYYFVRVKNAPILLLLFLFCFSFVSRNMANHSIKEPVRLRSKTLKNGVESLYLDIYQDGQRHYEYLKLYLNPGTDPLTKLKNRNAMDAARVLQAKRLVEIQSGVANIMTTDKRKIKFIDYYQDYYSSRPNVTDRYKLNSEFALYRWITYAGEDVLLCKITPEMLVGFANHLKSVHNMYRQRKVMIYPGEGRSGGYISTQEAEDLVRELSFRQKKSYSQIFKETGIAVRTVGYIHNRLISGGKELQLSDATVNRYFKYITAPLNRASSKGLIAVNPVAALESGERPHGDSPERVFLTLDEVSRLVDAQCDYPAVKNMFLFSCFTGLRFSDVKALSWGKIDDSMIGTTIQKTKKPIYIPISNNARRWLPERGSAGSDGIVFADCPNKNTICRCIDKWAKAAGIDKHVTFHVARHTFATLSLEYGADLYTISKLLGHQRVTTTQIYAKVIDKKKEEAVNLIPDLDK